MKRQTERGANPRELLCGFLRQRMGVRGIFMFMIVVVVVLVMMMLLRVFLMAAIFRVAFGQIVVMKMKEPLQEKHREKSTQHPGDGPVKRAQLLISIRQEMQQGNSEHEAGD